MRPYVNEEFGVFIIQQGDGNLIVKRGTPDNATDIIWASMGVLDNADDFFSQINPDSNLVTYVGTPEAPGEVLWSSQSDATEIAKAAAQARQDEVYFLGIDCNSEVVSVYAGMWDSPHEGVSVWNSQPTSPPTMYPTRPPTTAPPTAAPEPTQPPVPVSLELGDDAVGEETDADDSTSSASAPSTFASMLAVLLMVNRVFM